MAPECGSRTPVKLFSESDSQPIGKKPIQFMKRTPEKDYNYVDDVVDAFLMAADP